MIQTTRCSSVLCLMVLLAVQTRYADADVEPLKIELNPSDYVPLAVGNRWTYEHFYWNNSYPHGGWSGWNLEDLKPLEIPSYPHGWDNPMPPDSLTTVKRILTIEITHTEMIDGLEYFVFSSDDYAWPPLPEFFWGGKKVRLSAEGFLVFRWNGQDVPLYDFGHHHHLDAPNSYKYVTHEYGVTLPGEFIAANIGFGRGMEFYFDGLRIEGSESSSLYDLSKVFFTFEYLGEAVWRNFFCDFLQGYGVGQFDIRAFSTGFNPLIRVSLTPISANIYGEEIPYPTLSEPYFTSVQPTSWGHLKSSLLRTK